MPSLRSAKELPSPVRLPLRSDAEALRRDALALPAELWTPHFNTSVYHGDWSGIAFRSPGGDERRLYPDPTNRAPFRDTPALDRCPAVKSTLAAFRCELAAARFLRLGPGAYVLPHRDYDLGIEVGQVRLHVPVVTNPEVDFYVEEERLEMQPGETWYADFGLPHRVRNRGSEARIHLVIDCVLDAWLEGLLVEGARAGQREASSAS
ncbi:MAG: aspartyl/asparaginyl beta-hydroxylase domain-containing protein [Polyangiales bacterium]